MTIDSADMIITEYIAREGVLRLLKQNAEELEQRYNPFFLRKLYGRDFSREKREKDPEMLAVAIRGVLEADSTPWYQEVREGGIYRTLWNLSQDQHCGFRVITEKIPVKQEWIEICESEEENPYVMDSGPEVILAVTGHGEYLIRKLSEAGIMARMIGTTVPDHDRILLQGGKVRYLNRP